MLIVLQIWAIVWHCYQIERCPQLVQMKVFGFIKPITSANTRCIAYSPAPTVPWALPSSEGLTTDHVTAATALPASGFDWFLRVLLGALAIAIGRACWRRRVDREARQKEQEASKLAERTRDLALEKQRAEEGNKIKAQFLARISQDIQTPINELLNTLERSLMTTLTGEQRDLLERSKSSAREVLTRLGGVLDISIVEAERLLVNRVEFCMRDWTRRLVGTIAARARENSVELQTDIGGDFPDQLVGDPEMLGKVLHTLLKHAIRLSAPGKVTMVMRLDRRATNGSSRRTVPIFFSVEGRGMNRDNALPVDDSANQSDDEAEPVLPLCDRLLSLMGGRIWVYSHEGRSSICFTVQFEAPRPTAAETAAPRVAGRERSKAPSLRALLVESNRVEQLAVLPVLEKQGLHCLVAADGNEAIAVLERFPLDLIIVANQTSNRDGLEASRLIRARQKQIGSQVPILALTERNTRADRDACLRAGVDACLSKPLQPAQLREVIETAVLRSKARSANISR